MRKLLLQDPDLQSAAYSVRSTVAVTHDLSWAGLVGLCFNTEGRVKSVEGFCNGASGSYAAIRLE